MKVVVSSSEFYRTGSVPSLGKDGCKYSRSSFGSSSRLIQVFTLRHNYHSPEIIRSRFIGLFLIFNNHNLLHQLYFSQHLFIPYILTLIQCSYFSVLSFSPSLSKQYFMWHETFFTCIFYLSLGSCIMSHNCFYVQSFSSHIQQLKNILPLFFRAGLRYIPILRSLYVTPSSASVLPRRVTFT